MMLKVEFNDEKSSESSSSDEHPRATVEEHLHKKHTAVDYFDLLDVVIGKLGYCNEDEVTDPKQQEPTPEEKGQKEGKKQKERKRGFQKFDVVFPPHFNNLEKIQEQHHRKEPVIGDDGKALRNFPGDSRFAMFTHNLFTLLCSIPFENNEIDRSPLLREFFNAIVEDPTCRETGSMMAIWLFGLTDDPVSMH